MDAALFVLLVVSFATFCTVHVAVSAALGARGPWWRGAVALVVVPLALYWAIRERLRKRSIAWASALVVYATLNLAARIVKPK